MRSPVGQLAVLLSISPLMAGCSKIEAWRKPEIAACRQFVLSGLRSPATYKEVSSASSDDKDADGKLIKAVTIEYDAANAFGTPVRGNQMCEFDMSASDEFAREPSAAAVLASADRSMGKNGGSCCRRPTDVKAGDPLANMTMEDVPSMNNGVAR